MTIIVDGWAKTWAKWELMVLVPGKIPALDFQRRLLAGLNGVERSHIAGNTELGICRPCKFGLQCSQGRR